MIAVVPVRAGVLPAGGAEAVAEAGGRVIVVGDGAGGAGRRLAAAVQADPASSVAVVEAQGFRPGRWAQRLAPLLVGEDVVVLPGSPDGRDLAPRLAYALGRPLLAGATLVSPGRVLLARYGSLVEEELHPTTPVVATLEPGARGSAPTVPDDDPGSDAARALDVLEPVDTPAVLEPADSLGGHDAVTVEVTGADPAAMDLTEAPRIVAGGAGLGDREAFALLAGVATALGASMGATRVVTDAGWVPHERQIGTTGVSVRPRLYVAFGISGAVQHTGGLGHPRHVVSVNLDPSCPMMAMADLAVVADARAVLECLADRLAVGQPRKAAAHG